MTARAGRLRLVHSTVPGRPAPSFPCTNPFGLTPAELRREIRRLSARGWQLWEIRRRFAPECKDDNT